MQVYSTSGVTGALLLSVVGGNLSEGINFSDDLGRYMSLHVHDHYISIKTLAQNGHNKRVYSMREFFLLHSPNNNVGVRCWQVYVSTLYTDML